MLLLSTSPDRFPLTGDAVLPLGAVLSALGDLFRLKTAIPNEMVGLPDASVALPALRVAAPGKMVAIPEAMGALPSGAVSLPNEMGWLPGRKGRPTMRQGRATAEMGIHPARRTCDTPALGSKPAARGIYTKVVRTVPCAVIEQPQTPHRGLCGPHS